MRTAFNMFDQDGSGSIDKTELLQILQTDEMKEVFPVDMLVSYMQQVDLNGDGQIDFDEFQEMMANC